MIKCEDLRLFYNNQDVFQIDQLNIERPGRFLISGDNGTGKSTLVRAILNTHREFAGRILIDDRPNTEMSRLEIARRISWLPQSPGPDVEFSVGEYIEQAAFHRTLPWKAQVIQTLGIQSLLPRSYARLSGGEKQLCRLARALSPQSDYVFLDEPDAFLSRRNRARMLQCLTQMGESRAVIVISHYGTEYPGFKNILDLELD